MKTKLPLAKAESIAETIVRKLSSRCLRIEIAGSIRRKKPEVGDIEIIAEPYPTRDLFNNETYEPHELDEIDWTLYGRLVKGGHKYKQIELPNGINLDLFIVTPPAQWGVQFLIRTGPAEYSHKFVTARNQGGMLPSYLKVKDGAIWHGENRIETPEEKDVFELIGIPFAEPENRS